jgi:hypothetical protein
MTNEPKQPKKGTPAKVLTTKESRAQRSAENTIDSVIPSATIAAVYSGIAIEDAKPFYDEINKTKKRVVDDNNMADVETMLLAQAHALQSVFWNMMMRAQKAEYNQSLQIFLGMGLKAQSQCRTTLEALAEIKNPRHPATFVKQQNIANNQQVNNEGAAPHLQLRESNTLTQVGAGAENITNNANKLLEAKSYERLDTRTQSTTSSPYQTMETVD